MGESGQGRRAPVGAGGYLPYRAAISETAPFLVAGGVPVQDIETGPLTTVVSVGQR